MNKRKQHNKLTIFIPIRTTLCNAFSTVYWHKIGSPFRGAFRLIVFVFRFVHVQCTLIHYCIFPLFLFFDHWTSQRASTANICVVNFILSVICPFGLFFVRFSFFSKLLSFNYLHTRNNMNRELYWYRIVLPYRMISYRERIQPSHSLPIFFTCHISHNTVCMRFSFCQGLFDKYFLDHFRYYNIATV